MKEVKIRHIEPSDYPSIISVVNDWWGGRIMNDMLPKLFFVHFRQSSFVATQGEDIVGFLVGFLSQTYPEEAYIHFVGVHPDFRKHGIGNSLYEQFFNAVKNAGCNIVRCVTAPVNKESILFHQRLGFSIEKGNKLIDGIAVAENYDGRGGDRVLFYKMFNA